MKQILIALVVWASVAFAGPSTTYLWTQGRPMYTNPSGVTAIANTPPACMAWVPNLSLANATTMTYFVTGVSSVVDKCSVSLWIVTGGGTTMIASSGSQSCGTTGVHHVSGLSAFNVIAGQKYLVCMCGNLSTAFAAWDDLQANGFRNQLAVPLNTVAANGCDVNMNPPGTLGALSPATFHTPLVLFGTSTP